MTEILLTGTLNHKTSKTQMKNKNNDNNAKYVACVNSVVKVVTIVNTCRHASYRTRSDINRSVQPQKVARSLKYHINCTICVAKTKALISCAVTLFSHDAAQSGT